MKLYQVHPAFRKPSQGESRVHLSKDGKTTLCGRRITSAWKEGGIYCNCKQCRQKEEKGRSNANR